MNTKTLLIVESEPAMIELYLALLTAFGNQLQILTANNAATALQLCQSNQVDLITTDLKRESESGEAFVARLNKLYPLLPVMIISALPAYLSQVELHNLGAVAYLEKPFAVDSYVHKISVALHLPILAPA